MLWVQFPGLSNILFFFNFRQITDNFSNVFGRFGNVVIFNIYSVSANWRYFFLLPCYMDTFINIWDTSHARVAEIILLISALMI